MKKVIRLILRFLLSRSKEFYILLISILVRLRMSFLLGVWFDSTQEYDDVLLMKYAISHSFTDTNSESLLKLRGYSYFLEWISKSHMSYVLALALVWIVIALLAKRLVYDITQRKTLSYFFYFYLLFFPSAFDSWLGTRLYRNSILIPCYFLTFLWMLHILCQLRKKKFSIVSLTLETLVLGITVSFTYFLKEDGIWIYCILLAFTVYALGWMMYWIKQRKQRIKFLLGILIVCIPLTTFQFSKHQYQLNNEKQYSVSYLQTRTDGQLGEFVNRVYKIRSKNRTSEIWAPKDAIEKAFKASSTLSKNSDLLKAIEKGAWVQGNINKHPLKGDFLTWALRTALEETDMWTTELEVDHFFERVNEELDQAFEDGTLQKDKKFQLVSSTGGRDFSEMKDLIPMVKTAYNGVIHLTDYNAGGLASNTKKKKLVKKVSNLLRIPSIENSKITSKQERGNRYVNFIFKVYRIINPILYYSVWLAMIVALLEGLIKAIFKKGRNRSFYFRMLRGLSLAGFMVIGIGYTYGICWFSSFLESNSNFEQILNFYCAGLPSILVICEITALALLDTYFFKKKRSKH